MLCTPELRLYCGEYCSVSHREKSDGLKERITDLTVSLRRVTLTDFYSLTGDGSEWNCLLILKCT